MSNEYFDSLFDAIEFLPEKWVTIDINKIDQKIFVSIRDSGPGIKEEIVAKMMQPFFTTKSIGKGTGLGLSIALGIVQDHKGILTYDSTSEHTRFVLEIPICD